MSENGYWEIYDDQSSTDFSELSYINLSGVEVCVSTEEDLEAQVREIRRTTGRDTEIKVYR